MEAIALGGSRWCYGFGDRTENFEHTGRALHLGVGVQTGAGVNGQPRQPVGQHLGLELKQGMVAGRFKGIAGDELLELGGLAGQQEGLSGSSHGSVELRIPFVPLLALGHLVVLALGAVLAVCPFLGDFRMLAPEEPSLFLAFEWHRSKKVDVTRISLLSALPSRPGLQRDGPDADFPGALLLSNGPRLGEGVGSGQ